jgi:hypothetical protein
MPSPATTYTISREDLVHVASDAECIFRVFTVLTGRAQNDLCDRLTDLVDQINSLGGDPDGIDDEVRLRGSERAIRWLDELARDERKLLERQQNEVRARAVANA